MIRPIFQIELQKQRALILSVSCVFAITLLLAILRQLVTNQSIAEGLTAIIFLLVVAGIPCLAVALPASAGASLQQNPNRSIEDALPFDPRSRLLATYLVSLLHFILISVLILAAGMATGALKTAEDLLHEFEWRRSVAVLVLIQAHLLAFVLSYISKQAIIGASSSLALCALELSFLIVSSTRKMPYEFDHSEAVTFVIALLFSFLFATTVFLLSRKLYRDGRPGYVTILIFLLFLLGGPIVVFARAQWSIHRLENELHPALIPSWIFNPEKESMFKQGVIMNTATEKFVRVKKDGTKLQFPESLGYSGIAYGPDQSVWILEKGDGEHSYVLKKEKEGKVSTYSTFISKDFAPSRFLVRGSKVYLYGANAADRNVYTVIEHPGETLKWVKGDFKDFLQASFEDLIKKGDVAYASPDRRELLRKRPDGSIQTWKLSAIAQNRFPLELNLFPAAYHSDNGPGFMLTVRSGSGEQLIVCRPDGSIDQPWPHIKVSELRIVNLPGGGAAAVSWPRNYVYILDRTGNAFPELKVSTFFPTGAEEKRFQLKRLGNDQLWAFINDQFVRFNLRDRSHQIVADQITDWSITSSEEGIYYTRRGKIWLVDWDGKKHAVASATLN